jgi:Tol biopolymer transport system component
MRIVVLGALVLAVAAVPAGASASMPVLPPPQIFAPGIVSAGANDGSPTFSPDGNTLFFTRSGASWGVILESDRAGGRWSQPRIAPFSGRWNDWSPEFAPDGKSVVFVSVRPNSANLWRTQRTASGWSDPVKLPDAVNIGPSVWKPSIVADGSIYFVSIDAKRHKRLYRSQYASGAYQPAQALSFSDGTTGDVDPEVAPDESFMFFASDGRIKGDTKDHLFFACKSGGAWQAPVPVRFAGDADGPYDTDNEPHLSHDLRTLYFSSDRSGHAVFPRTPEQAQRDVDQLDTWDNSNANAWSVSLAPLFPLTASGACSQSGAT